MLTVMNAISVLIYDSSVVPLCSDVLRQEGCVINGRII